MERMFIVVILLSSVTASQVEFSATPSELKTNLTDVATMRCSVHDSTVRAATSAVDVHRVMSLFITRADGQDVASVTGTDAPLAFVQPGNLHVSGSVSAVSGDGYIELSWTDPSVVWLGEYTCEVTARNSHGHTVMLSQSLELLAVEPTMADVIAALKQRTMANKQQMTKLQQCTRHHVGFTASFQKTGTISLSRGTQAKFDKIIMNQGAAYDPSTGAFTCPTAGMYSFHIHLLGYGSSHACFQLQVNGVSMTSAHADGDDYNTASTSAVLELKQGDVVAVVACWDSVFAEHSESNHNTWGYNSNIFNGHLVEASSCYA